MNEEPGRNQTAKRLSLLLLAATALGLSQCRHADHTPYDFSLTLDMTPDAQNRLHASRDNIEITTYFYGEAAPAFRARPTPPTG
jgi:hypothetical protein